MQSTRVEEEASYEAYPLCCCRRGPRGLWEGRRKRGQALELAVADVRGVIRRGSREPVQARVEAASAVLWSRSGVLVDRRLDHSGEGDAVPGAVWDYRVPDFSDFVLAGVVGNWFNKSQAKVSRAASLY
jgi:hypothetical protein